MIKACIISFLSIRDEKPQTTDRDSVQSLDLISPTYWQFLGLQCCAFQNETGVRLVVVLCIAYSGVIRSIYHNLWNIVYFYGSHFQSLYKSFWSQRTWASVNDPWPPQITETCVSWNKHTECFIFGRDISIQTPQSSSSVLSLNVLGTHHFFFFFFKASFVTLHETATQTLHGFSYVWMLIPFFIALFLHATIRLKF